jgi:putative membrane protein
MSIQNEKTGKVENRQVAGDHLANERTMLAWIRTGIGIIAFGFVVVKFSIFIKQISSVLGSTAKVHPHGYSSIIGILLVVVGAIIIFLSYLRYRSTMRQLDNGFYRHSSVLIQLLVGLIIMIALVLTGYLISTT